MLTANAGVILAFGENGPVYGIDALHDTKAGEFSSLAGEQIKNTFAFLDRTPPEALLITHDHPDHCSVKLLEQAAGRYPDCRIIRPWAERKNRNIIYTVNGRSIAALSLPHRHAPDYPEADNDGFVMEVEGKTVFAPGDAEPTSGEMRKIVQDFHPDVAVLPFLWVTLSGCRKVLDQLAPKNTVFVHLPFEEEDEYGYNRAALTDSRRFCSASAVLNRHMQTVSFEL